ncbi:hypothetical protein MMC20_003797 [Loxospora ochrophaea]|nr:hypothetical protein [Loxospora ochrophaea]
MQRNGESSSPNQPQQQTDKENPYSSFGISIDKVLENSRHPAPRASSETDKNGLSQGDADLSTSGKTCEGSPSSKNEVSGPLNCGSSRSFGRSLEPSPDLSTSSESSQMVNPGHRHIWILDPERTGESGYRGARINVLLDTGSCDNLIAAKALSWIKLPDSRKVATKEIVRKTATGQELKYTEQALLTWRNPQGIERETYFYIVNDLPVNSILGWEFIFGEGIFEFHGEKWEPTEFWARRLFKTLNRRKFLPRRVQF